MAQVCAEKLLCDMLSCTAPAGRRMDNRSQERPGGAQKGIRFFIEDEDEFGLEDMLQVLCIPQCCLNVLRHAICELMATKALAACGLAMVHADVSSTCNILPLCAGAVFQGLRQHICAGKALAARCSPKAYFATVIAERRCAEAAPTAGHIRCRCKNLTCGETQRGIAVCDACCSTRRVWKSMILRGSDLWTDPYTKRSSALFNWARIQSC